MSSPTPPPPSFAPAPSSLSPEPEQPRLSEPARIIDTFVAPSKTFLDIRQNASWWIPWLLMSLFSIAVTFEMGQKINFDQIAHNLMDNNKQYQQASPEQQSRMLAVTIGVTKWGGYFSPLFIMFPVLVTVLVLWVTFNFAMGAEIPFNRAMSIVFYGWLPSVVGAIVTGITIWFADPEGFRVDNPIGTNPAHFMDPQTTSKFLLGVLSSLDVIGLWIVVLIGIGFALNAKKKLSYGSAIGIVAGWYFLWKLISAGLAGLRG
jgi:hypothetical protein